MTDPNVDAALARGAYVVTPNKRLARELATRFDRGEVALGRRSWPAARALPWTAFVGDLMRAAQDAGMPLPAHTLDSIQSAHLWRRIVGVEFAEAPLADADALATLAADAWGYAHGWGSGGESWRGFSGGGSDVEAFVRWAEAFARESARHDAIDIARAPDALARIAADLPGVATLDIACTGFLDFAPQQRRLLDALAAAGANVERLDVDETGIADHARLAAGATPRDEIARALAWARDRALADPGARIGVVVLDLAKRRDQVRALAEDILCAGLQWPGHEDHARPYELSAAGTLASVPVVATALDLITLAHRPLAREALVALVRSPYLPGGEAAWVRRAALERQVLAGGRPELTAAAAIAALASCDRTLAERWRRMAAVRVPQRDTPRGWAERWRSLLELAGWCEGRALASAEFQARAAWGELLAGFVALAPVSATIAQDEALATLRLAAEGRAFQPESEGARVRILGMLEAAGLEFDALWVAGCNAETWPRAPEPNPLLPLAWQCERDVPRSHPARELAYARRLTARLSRSAADVVFSHAAALDDHPSAPSPLIARLPSATPVPAPASTAQRAFSVRPALEILADASAPAVREEARVAGGAALIDAQSACPFKAAAQFRLRAPEWPSPEPGLSAQERGTLLHGALDAFWREVRDSATLRALGEEALDAAIGRAVDVALALVRPDRWSALPPVVAGGESARMARLVRRWLTDVERARPPFRIVDTEARRTLRLAGFALEVRIDRVDALDDGSAAIIDYKSGEAIAPAKWFGERPEAPQLALYMLACEEASPRPEPHRPIAALAFAQLRAGDVRAVGLAADAAQWPALTLPQALRGKALADWAAATARLRASVLHLARGVRLGEAAVLPRADIVCRRCHLQPVCRIEATRDVRSGNVVADDEARDA